MRKIFCLSVLFVLIPLLSICKPVDSSTAQQIASNFWAVVNDNTSFQKWTDITAQTGFQEFYIFTRGTDNGFVIVAADDCVQPILGYSTDNRFVTPLPAHVFSFLNRYEQEISYYKENNISATTEITQLWESLLEGTYAPKQTTTVTPLLSTTWDQAPFYNNLCPTGENGEHAVTGCVATATAQVMKYWNWPINGVGSHSYTDENFGSQSADFSATTYNWQQMPNALSGSSTSAQVNAVATLMYHIGVAVEMGYGYASTGGSGAAMNSFGSSYPSAENALKNYFKYENTLHSVSKNNVSETEWISTLKSELDAERPMLERGHGEGGGHAFVCDGYDDNELFHINWGWGGLCDGHFAHNALNPSQVGIGGNISYSFNDEVAVIVGIKPLGEYHITANSSDNTMGLTSGSGFYNSGETASLLATAKPGYRFTQWNDSVTDNPRTINVSSDSAFTAFFNNIEGYDSTTGCKELYYDNDNYYTNIGAEGSFWWGVRFPESSLVNNNTLSAVKFMVIESGNYVLRIYQGGANAPETLLYSETLTLDGAPQWFTDTLSSPITLNTAQPLWITLYSSAANPAAVSSTYAGNPDGSWFSINGHNWKSLCDYDLYYTWMIRALFTDYHTITVISDQPSMGRTIGSGNFPIGSEIQIEAIPYNGYEFIGWDINDSVSFSALNPRTITVTGDKTYTAYFRPTVVGIEEPTLSDILIYCDGRRIFVDGAEGTSVEIYDITGRLVIREELNSSNHTIFTVRSSGIYVVHTGSGITKKVMVVR